MTERDDEELRWRLEVLRAQFDDGKIRIASHLAEDFESSLLAVRRGSDGRIDLSTVDARVRSMALMAAFVHNREEAKSAISLEEISSSYFEIIEKNLGFLIEQARDKGLNANQFAHAVSNTPGLVAELAPQIPDFVDALGEFWEAVADSSHYHLQDLAASKAIYGGDLFPSYQRNIASTAGLYIDTIVLSDPFWQSRHIFRGPSSEQQVFYLVKHAINAWQYRDLALADVGSPIVVLSPFQSSVDENEADFLAQVMDVDGLKHARALFGREFESKQELHEFVEPLETPQSLVQAVADPSRLIFDVEWSGSLIEQVERALSSEWAALVGSHAGLLVETQCFGRMGQATDILLKSRYLSGTPLIDAPTSWRYFNWKLEYNSGFDQASRTNLHMLKGLQHVGQTDEPWLGNIPPEALIEMRRVGAFEEIREALSNGVEELASVNPEAFFRSSDQIVDNIRRAFAAHQAELTSLRTRGLRFAGYDIGSMVVAGAIDIASIVTGLGTFGAASFAVSQLIDAPKLREIPERFRTLKDAHTELIRSPMGLFFQHKS